MTENKNQNGGKVPDGRRAGRLLVRIVVPVVVVIAGAVGAYILITTKPRVKRRPPREQAVLVEVTAAALSSERVVVQAMGTVQAAETVVLRPRVGGEVIQLSPEFVPGGRFRSGEAILKIDSKDYDLVVRQREADVSKAAAGLQQERGLQAVARREYELLNTEIRPEDRELVLRGPQLKTAQAALDAAKAALDKAKLDLERTTLAAPFRAMVITKDVSLGTQVTANTQVATLVGIDEYWIQAAVPVDELKWIRLPKKSGETGAAVRICNGAAWGSGVSRTGRVRGLVGDLEREGRMARIIVAVKDPLGDGSPALIIGMYVRMEIEGAELRDVVSIPRSALRDGTSVWIMDDDGKLEIRAVKTVWRTRDRVCVKSGIRPGERVVVSGIAVPVEGMPLRVRGEAARPAGGNGRGE